ncbi:RNA polymerase sigma factor [Pseudotenacibaculum haliotis]|uniref:RNA polymerase sigma factor n=1 Tax=Pseudotenacibaculum haliotis TaxID=1862138 RepID=A0ABW5LS24_9FLAO
MQHQENQTFEQVLEANKDKIYRICRIYAVQPIEPEDLFQEVVYQIWKSYASFQGKSSVDTWIYRIALNVCIRARGKLNKKNEKTVRLNSIQYAATETTSDPIEDKKYAALKACIQALKDIDKSVVTLSLEELPYKEIATVTGLSENHIAVKMKRIRKSLFGCITSKIKSYVG